MLGTILGFAKTLVAPIAGIVGKRQERKKIKERAQAKLAQSKLEGDQQITLSDAEWESLVASGLNESWKDEYITLIITSPILGIMIGSVYAAFTGDQRIMTGIIEAIAALEKIGFSFEDVLLPVVLAAIGLKFWRAR